MSRTCNPAGSVWHRWDPHLHVPGTLLNDQYEKATVDDFCAVVDSCQPPIRALGITDYYVLDTYEHVRKTKADGKLPGVDLVFPNVEIRLDVGTVKGAAVNAHLLFSPDDPNHVTKIERFLAGLKFRLADEEYLCTRADLIRLGRDHNGKLKDDLAALRAGANQFKVSLVALTDALKVNKWAQENMLIAVPASSTDGTSGVKTPDHSFDALRATIECSCHIIFSGNPKDAAFWSGRGVLSAHDVEQKYKSVKPCLHGCDAHSLERVGQPDENRLCWVKGDVTFESLRQACIEPAGRAYVGPEPPRGGFVGETVERVKLTNAPWMVPPEIAINPGMVAIIGARGSGKTALADAIAVGAYSMSAHVNERSFIRRAAPFLHKSSVSLHWESGEQSTASLCEVEVGEAGEFASVQYLSQQFVDDLCASDGVADRLLDEIKRVIYNSHPETEREGAITFEELYYQTCGTVLDAQARNVVELERLTALFVEQIQLRQSVPQLTKQIEETQRTIAQLLRERNALIATGQEERIARHQELLQALTYRKAALEVEQKKIRAIEALQSDIADFRTREAHAWLASAQAARADAGLTSAEWATLLPGIPAATDGVLQAKLSAARAASAAIAGTPVADVPDAALDAPLIRADAKLTEQPVGLLAAETQRLARHIGIDKNNSVRFNQMTTRLEKQNRLVAGLQAQLAKAAAAGSEISKLRARRKEIYKQAFESFSQLTALLDHLYAPLADTIHGESGALAKMTFMVRRTADVARWSALGEELFDLRKDGPFKGRGALFDTAVEELVPAWENGTAEEAAKAVDTFVEKYAESLRGHRLDSIPHPEWLGRVWAWVYAIDHIKVSYSLQYGGVDIEKLSPGTRGIVLLLLYLALDKEDVRPLIIDQPEENLDPQSVYDELVARFRSAKERRQIIVVTHNANLVVNADADQVIVATAGEHKPGKLPEIKYESGGLENSYIRTKVCEILEGGESAFRERAKRLRVEL